MADGAKKGAVGVLALLGLGLARGADDCGRVAMRSSRAVDDIAVDGTRAATRLSGSVDEVGEGAARMQWGPKPRSHTSVGLTAAVDSQTTRSADDLGKTLADGGLDVATSVVDFASDGPDYDEVLEPGSPIKCPAAYDLESTPGAWPVFTKGFGVACAPHVFVARTADERQLSFSDEVFEVAQMARDCAELGTACVFVGSDDPSQTTQHVEVALRQSLRANDRVEYIRRVTTDLSDDAGVSWLAVMQPGGQLLMVTPR